MQALFPLANHNSASPWFTQEGQMMTFVLRISVDFLANNMTFLLNHHRKAESLDISNVQSPANSFLLVLALNLLSFNHSPTTIYLINMSKIVGSYHGRRVYSRIPHRSGRPSCIPKMSLADVNFDTSSGSILNEGVTRMTQPSHNFTDTSNKFPAKHAKTRFQNTDSQSISDSLSDPVKWSEFKNELNATMDTADWSEVMSDHSSTDTFSQHRFLMLESPPAGIYMFQEGDSNLTDFELLSGIGFDLRPTKQHRIEDNGSQIFSIHPSNSKPGINRVRRPVLDALEFGSQVKESPYNRNRKRSILNTPDINQPTDSHSLLTSPVFGGVEESIDPALKILTPPIAPTLATPPTDNNRGLLSSPVFGGVEESIDPALKFLTPSIAPTSATSPTDYPGQPSPTSLRGSNRGLLSRPVFGGVEESIDPALKFLTPSIAPTSATSPTDYHGQPSPTSSRDSYENTSDRDCKYPLKLGLPNGNPQLMSCTFTFSFEMQLSSNYGGSVGRNAYSL
ncbi:uncharacterized protein MELLADRAFT_96214 [Melampsora larici-populina 98AG31]|uniref:Uncharacterized protein n=1 Tax=Melampsora larici-populina (strain 98AG31 / pathotype 3-4-7) TaxID=747676 RepID=F4SBD2_MELLP|nr:uncharacterized protein MELLADRAFT_96214 [Melampsora larici-populina 98AG31]EGF98051.1 hypothetical protein MELLADRAFT_96214 [Melampsora larici-populina 98AG31]